METPRKDRVPFRVSNNCSRKEVKKNMRFQVPTTMIMKMYDVMPCSMMEV
jgi:hypothetical protein